MTMSVNVSGRQLEEPEFVAEVQEVLLETGLDPRLLVLEITESVLMRDTDRVARRLQDLKSLGVGLAIDDFGTGYSSLGYLKNFPVDILKVDRSFISDISKESKHAVLAEAVVRMGTTLNLRTVAEGVEIEEQADELDALGCLVGQGFLFARPLPASACEEFLNSQAAKAGFTDAPL
jgi:EAL domain-containing protein (putative c-di-GMP-specific phosphodiesterase class I)